MRAAHLAFLLLLGCRGVDAPAGEGRAAGSRAARLALDSMLAEGRTAHLETNAEQLAAGLADTLISIDGGAVSRQPRDSVRAMFDRYFAGASYRTWEDVQPPAGPDLGRQLARLGGPGRVRRSGRAGGGRRAQAAHLRLGVQRDLRPPLGALDDDDGDLDVPADTTAGVSAERSGGLAVALQGSAARQPFERDRELADPALDLRRIHGPEAELQAVPPHRAEGIPAERCHLHVARRGRLGRSDRR